LYGIYSNSEKQTKKKRTHNESFLIFNRHTHYLLGGGGGVVVPFGFPHPHPMALSFSFIVIYL
jgi:hypothetical protein